MSTEDVQPFDEPGPVSFPSKEERTWAMLCHISALLSYVVVIGVVGLSFIGPLICWLLKRDTSSFVDYHGKQSLNFQLNLLIYALLIIPIGFATCGMGFFLYAPLAIYSIIMCIVGGVKANSGERFTYPFTFGIIK